MNYDLQSLQYDIAKLAEILERLPPESDVRQQGINRLTVMRGRVLNMTAAPAAKAA